ncbi:MAG: NUDIX hydrolase [Microgenomates group bacterium GW2011_GWC1_37_8]|uniref:NUDIX hydrolase n=1 Tax=Candidatus Woesebacteria bacterium GW2011_GWB1_38_8 TaxID=1618570 RepID=A0A0G0PAA4_9BACT|nr:MAG: NUDIX hydrolase [Microgenomates group bacterium GW2011_GWC1_37_8]KKQ86226.1 MAG: NUDIX hydrolase [Candidatus Woesebacteria bacterium GW2011_GWB1_38_8]
MQNKNKLGEKNIPTHVVAVFAIVQKRDKFLIAKRSSDDPQAGGMWSVPSGKVELLEGEMVVEETLNKEVMEEVGLEIEDEIIYLGSDGFYRVSGHHVVGLTFLCKWKKGVAKPLEDQEEVKWVTLKEFKQLKNMPDYLTGRFNYLEKYLNSK